MWIYKKKYIKKSHFFIVLYHQYKLIYHIVSINSIKNKLVKYLMIIP